MRRFWARFFPSTTIAWYTGRMFLARTLAFLGGLLLVLMALDLLGESGRILSVAGNGEAELWKYVSLRAPQIIALFLPFSVLLAALLVFLTLNQNSEITIFKASGLSAHQILGPFLLAGFLVSIVHFAFNERILVRANAELSAWQAVDYHPVIDGTVAQKDIWVRADQSLWHASSVAGLGAETRLQDVTVYLRTDEHLDIIYRAEQARPNKTGWTLINAHEFVVKTGMLRDLPEVDLLSTTTPQQFTVQSVNGDHVSFWQLRPAIKALKEAGKPTSVLQAKLYHKISGPLSAVLMPLLGAVAAFGLARAGKLFVRAVMGLALGFAFFVMDNFAMAMSDFGTYPPLVAAWGPFLLFFLVGESVLIRMEE